MERPLGVLGLFSVITYISYIYHSHISHISVTHESTFGPRFWPDDVWPDDFSPNDFSPPVFHPILQWRQLASEFFFLFKLLFLIVCLLLAKLVCTKGCHCVNPQDVRFHVSVQASNCLIMWSIQAVRWSYVQIIIPFRN